jgi:MFS family permease
MAAGGSAGVSEPPAAALRPEVASQSTEAADDVSVVSLVLSLACTLYIPLFLLSVGDAIQFPTLPLLARSLVENDSLVGIVLCGREIGIVVASVPCGMFLSRFGVRCSMTTGLACLAASSLLVALSESFADIFPALLLGGCGSCLVDVCRMEQVKLAVRTHQRGRAIAVLGGVYRVASVLGPLVGGYTAHYVGPRAPYFCQVVAYLMTVALCLVCLPTRAAERAAADMLKSGQRQHPEGMPKLGVQKEPEAASDQSAAGAAEATTGVAAVARQNATALCRTGFAMMILMFLRKSREVIVPLKGDNMGMATDKIGVSLALGYLVDSLLFPAAGYISDAHGRKKCGVTAFTIISCGVLFLNSVDSFPMLCAASIVMGLGNGCSAGLVMTTGTDMAPPPPQSGIFLGLYSNIFSIGGLAPALIGAVADCAGFGTATLATGAIGVLGGLWYTCLVPETLTKKGQALGQTEKKHKHKQQEIALSPAPSSGGTIVTSL